MRVLLKLLLDCDADAAWRALQSPRAVTELYGPLFEVRSTEHDGLPVRWENGADAAVEIRLGGIVPLGTQLIAVHERSTTDRNGTVRIGRDTGMPLTGLLGSLDVWDHQMAVSPAPGDPSRTLWRDRLVIGGPTAAALWPLLWATWQWRGARLRALAPTWAHDPAPAAADAGS